jgi:hypothetical protein
MLAAAGNKTMELEGNLRAFQLPDILRFLAMGKMTGVLTIIGKERTIELTIKDGTLTGTGSSDRFPRLGQMLVYGGLLSRRKLDEVLESQRDAPSARMLGELLIEHGLVTREQIQSALTLQISEEIWDLFSWSDGTFKFEHGLKPSMDRPLVGLEIEPLIEDGFRHMEQWRVISANLSDPDLVFRVNPELGKAPTETRLPYNTWRVLSLINGRHSIQVLIYLCGLGRFETLCALDRLIAMQLIEPLPGQPRAYAPGRVGEAAAAGGGRPPRAPETTTEVDEEEEPGGRRGLFGIRRRGTRPHPAETSPRVEDKKAPLHVGPYVSGVGLACDLVSRLSGRLCAEPDFKSEGGAPALLGALWYEIGMRFPRADMLILREGRLVPDTYDAYLKIAGGAMDCLAGCHEDSLETLAQIARRLALLARERLGDRARRIVHETIQPFLDCTDIAYPGDFAARAWAERWTDALN